MEIAIIPKWIIKYISHDYIRQYDFNILFSNIIIILTFIVFKDVLINFLGYFPHFCLIDELFNIECPVCGTTRAFCEISKGNISNAVALNATSILVAAFFIFQIPLRIYSLTHENKNNSINTISKYIGRGIFTIIILYWIINLFLNN